MLIEAPWAPLLVDQCPKRTNNTSVKSICSNRICQYAMMFLFQLLSCRVVGMQWIILVDRVGPLVMPAAGIWSYMYAQERIKLIVVMIDDDQLWWWWWSWSWWLDDLMIWWWWWWWGLILMRNNFDEDALWWGLVLMGINFGEELILMIN